MQGNRAQFVYRLAFVLLCFLPTVGICGWIFARSLPGFVLSEKQEWERELTRRLGLRVTCEAVEYPRPDTAELTGIALANLETNEPLATIATLEVVREADRWKLTAWQVAIDSQHLPQFRQRLEECLLRLPAGDVARCEFACRELTLRDGRQGLTLRDVSGGWQATAQGPVAQLQFRLPEASADKRPALLVAERNRATIPPATRWKFDTGEVPLPCTLAASLFPGVQPLGVQATFSGQIDVVHSASQAHGRLQGSFDNVDLDALVSEQFPHQLSGLATIRLDEAEFDADRVTAVRGTAKASNGLVGRSLLLAACEQMQLASPLLAQLPEGNAPISFRHLSLGFDLRDTGLQLAGSADATRPNVLLSCAAGSLLEAPPRHLASPLSLARTLVPDQGWQVPAARNAQALARFLPAPDLQPAATAARPGHIPTRLAPAGNGSTPVVRQPGIGPTAIDP